MQKLRGQFDLVLCDGTELGVVMNMFALGTFLNEQNAELKNLGEMLATEEKALRFVPELLWCGVQAFYQLNDAEPPLSKGRFTVLFGSSEWDVTLQNLMTALEITDGSKKKPKTKKTKTK